MKKILPIIFIPSFLIAGCNSNGSSDKRTKITIANSYNSSYEYSVGLNETVYISLVDAIKTMKNSEDAVDLANTECNDIRVKALDFEDDEIAYLGTSLIYSANNPTLDMSLQTLSITCLEEFEECAISKISFICDEIVYNLDTDIYLYFNEDFESYPKVLNSYCVDSRNWYNGGVFDYEKLRYGERNLEGFAHGYLYMFDGVRYNRTVDTITLHSITFSENLTPYIKDVKYGLFDPNIDPLTLDYEKITFKQLNQSINLNETTNQNEELIFSFETNLLEDEFFVGGDIIYDLTINGIDYLVKKMYVLFNYSL